MISVLGTMLFNIFIHDIGSRIECTLSKFADGIKLTSTVDTTEGRDAVKRGLGTLRKRAHKNLMRFNKIKC